MEVLRPAPLSLLEVWRGEEEAERRGGDSDKGEELLLLYWDELGDEEAGDKMVDGDIVSSRGSANVIECCCCCWRCCSSCCCSCLCNNCRSYEEELDMVADVGKYSPIPPTCKI